MNITKKYLRIKIKLEDVDLHNHEYGLKKTEKKARKKMYI